MIFVLTVCCGQGLSRNYLVLEEWEEKLGIGKGRVPEEITVRRDWRNRKVKIKEREKRLERYE